MFTSRCSAISEEDVIDGTKDTNMCFLIDMLSDIIDEAHVLHSPHAESVITLLEFSSSAVEDGKEDSIEPVKVTYAAATAFDRYMETKCRALATISALVLKCVDSRYNWEFGWLMALETKKLAASTRLNLILSKTIPAPTGSALIHALSKKCQELEKNKKPLSRNTIRLNVFDNISGPFGYVKRTSAAGLSQNKKNPVATAFSVHHYTVNNTLTQTLNPMMKVENVPKNSPRAQTKEIPAEKLEPSQTEKVRVKTTRVRVRFSFSFLFFYFHFFSFLFF